MEAREKDIVGREGKDQELHWKELLKDKGKLLSSRQGEPEATLNLGLILKTAEIYPALIAFMSDFQ